MACFPSRGDVTRQVYKDAGHGTRHQTLPSLSPTMAYKVLLLAALVALTAADQAPSYTPPRPSYSAPQPTYRPAEPVAPPRYDFNWAVKDDYSGNDFGQQESRDGYDTQGSYYVQLPDGRLQRVTYTVNGDSGFVAEVTYEGEAQYPQPQPQPSYSRPQPQPTYQQPQPTYG